MLVRMLMGTGGPNGTACFAGEVYDLPDGLAVSWVAAGRATRVDGEAPADGGIVTMNGDPMVSPAPARKVRGR